MSILRQTKALQIVEEVIKSSPTPLSSADILVGVSEKDKTIDRATVFRIIKRLTDANKLMVVNFGEGKMRYEWKGEHHHHLVCTKCGSITAIHVCDAESMAINQARKAGFQIHSHSLEYFGLCKKCK